MYCPNCGTQNDGTNRFCLKCGSTLPSASAVNQPTVPLEPITQSTRPIAATPSIETPKRRVGAMIGIIALLVIAVIAVVVVSQTDLLNRLGLTAAPTLTQVTLAPQALVLPASNSASIPAPTPTVAPISSAVPPLPMGTGQICMLAFEDKNGDGLYAKAEEILVPDVDFTLADQSGVKGSYWSDGRSEPYCFDKLPAGPYTVKVHASSNAGATTPGLWAISLANGARFDVTFGLQTTIKPTPTPCPDTSPYGLSPNQMARLGCAAQGFVSSRKIVIQRFERGAMIIFAKPNNTFDNKGGAFIYALTTDGRVWRMIDSYIETSPNRPTWYSCDVKSNDGPEITGVPWRGFGKAWCSYPDVRQALGRAVTAEEGDISASFQSYETGRAFQVADWRGFPGWKTNRVYIVYLPTAEGNFIAGSWEQK